MKNTIVVHVKWYVSILIIDPTLSILAYLARIEKYFNIDKQYQHYVKANLKYIYMYLFVCWCIAQSLKSLSAHVRGFNHSSKHDN